MPGGFIKGVAKLAVGTAVTAGVAAGAAYVAQKPVTEFTCAQIDAHSELDADHCIKAVAVQLKNPAMCNSITGKRFEAEIEGKKIQMENPPKMECLTAIAAATNNPSLCDQVEGFLIANTKIDCLYRVAMQNGNATACAGIGSDTQSRAGSEMSKSGCMAAVARMPKQNPTAPVAPQTPPAPATPEPAAVKNQEAIDKCQLGGGTGFDSASGQCTCPAGATPQAATGCACEVKGTGFLSFIGLSRSTLHQRGSAIATSAAESVSIRRKASARARRAQAGTTKIRNACARRVCRVQMAARPWSRGSGVRKTGNAVYN